jgi:hypothetical protein
MRLHLLAWSSLGILVACGCGGGSSSNKDASKDAVDALSEHGPDSAPDAANDTAGGDIGEPGNDGGDGAVPTACATPTECPGQDSECSHRTCNDGVCGVGHESVGKVLTSQTVGDCQVRKCDDNGQTVTSADDADVPDDLNPCTKDICSNGVPSHTAQPENTSCGGAMLCNTTGQCAGCAVASDCPGTDSECRARVCTNGTCGFNYQPAGTALTDPTKGDCKGLQCDGLGVAQVVDLGGDLPSDDNPCTADQCNAGTPTFGPAPRSTACGDGKVCDGQSHCVACLTAASCPGVDNDCTTRTCTSGACGFVSAPSGKEVLAQVPGDCKKAVCDGQGAVTAVNDDTDPRIDNNACTDDVCTAGTPSNPPTAAQTACGGNLKCDGAGHCQGCVSAADCGANTECLSYACTSGQCVPSYASAGTAVAGQTAKDCRKSQCDGLGAVVNVPDDSDLPVDGLACTADVCTAGTPSNPAQPSGTACTEAGGSHCNGSGACVQCITPADCGAETECKKFTCSGQGVCGRNDPVAGTAMTTQTAGDCKTAICDGQGGTGTQNNDNDVPNDSNACTNDLCSAGTPSHSSAAQGTACGTNRTCDSSGNCVGCDVAADCGQDTACKVFTCNNHMCGRNDPADGTALPAGSQTAGDCKKVVCDGAGATRVANDDTDVSSDANACTKDLCSNGLASHPNEAIGKACSQNSGVMCDGAGNCGAALVRINEIESSDSTGPDWIELYNTSAVSTIDISGWIFRDNDDTHAYVFPAGTTIGPHAFLASDTFSTGTPNFGLGASDQARLFDPSGATLFDTYTWTTHAAQTYGRCPDGTGGFVDTVAPTRGTANMCP